MSFGGVVSSRQPENVCEVMGGERLAYGVQAALTACNVLLLGLAAATFAFAALLLTHHHNRVFVKPEPPSLQHLCMEHLCSYGAVCERDTKEPHRATCVCHQSLCPAHAHPVCGHNGQTYKNECDLRMEECSLQRRIWILSQGPCDPTSTQAAPMVTPRRFQNRDLCDGVRCHHGAHCIAGKCKCPECEASPGEPVCGNDSITYSSECELRRSACQMQRSLTVTSTGPCDDCMEGSGNGEGNAQSDDCWMERCHRFGGRWDVDAEDGPCLCLFSCSEANRNPVCGSDGIMYPGECDLRSMRCKTQKNIAISPTKSCKDASCNCNEHGSFSNTCDPRTGQCPCRIGVGGQNCDRCDPGFWGFRSLASGNDSCAPCKCDPKGSVRVDCNQMSGKCTCLEGVRGHHCDICPPGHKLRRGGCRADTGALAREGMRCAPGEEYVLIAGKPACKCNKHCSESNPIPVCGSDGMTYKSLCHLLASACLGFDVTMVHVGSCTGIPMPTLPATPLSVPTTNASWPDDDQGSGELEGSGRDTESSGELPVGAAALDGMTIPLATPASSILARSTCDKALHGCCPDGRTAAQNKQGLGCPETRLLAGTVHLEGPELGPWLSDPQSEQAAEVLSSVSGMLSDIIRESEAGSSLLSLQLLSLSHIPEKQQALATFHAHFDTDSAVNAEVVKQVLQSAGHKDGPQLEMSLELTEPIVWLHKHEFHLTSEQSDAESPPAQSLAAPTLMATLETQKPKHLEGHEQRWVQSFIPFFNGKTSFIERPSLKSVINNYPQKLTLKVIFLTDGKDGMLMYNGDRRDGQGDFVSLALSDSILEFRFDLGKGPAIIRSRNSLALGMWHEVRLERVGRKGTMWLDDGHAVSGESPGEHTSLNVKQPMYLGGVPNYHELSKNAAISKGLTGAIQQLTIGHVTASNLRDRSSRLVDVTNFRRHPCTRGRSPCRHGGHCQPHHANFSCLCPHGYSGKRCQKEGQLRSLGEELPIAFSGQTFLEFHNRISHSDKSQANTSVELWIKPNSAPSGLLLWSGNPVPGADLLALGLVDWHVELALNLGSGLLQLRSTVRLKPQHWFHIRVGRYLRSAWLQVGNENPVLGKTPGKAARLDTHGGLWIGATASPIPSDLLPSPAYDVGFRGCLRAMELGGQTVSLVRHFIHTSGFLYCPV
uniref:agrin-like n=1 Tax=Myxine glutinosa TaxID=7769 RepID=UPI00358F484E